MVSTCKHCFVSSPSLCHQLQAFRRHVRLVGSNMTLAVTDCTPSQHKISLPGSNLFPIYLYNNNYVTSRFSWAVNWQGQFHFIRKYNTQAAGILPPTLLHLKGVDFEKNISTVSIICQTGLKATDAPLAVLAHHFFSGSHRAILLISQTKRFCTTSFFFWINDSGILTVDKSLLSTSHLWEMSGNTEKIKHT